MIFHKQGHEFKIEIEIKVVIKPDAELNVKLQIGLLKSMVN
jgi:hypothetical protein